MFDAIKNWKFLNEDLKGWFIFVIAMTLILFAWKKILTYMQETVSEI